MLSKVLHVIREELPAETVIASDMTQIAYAANEVFPVSVPRTWLHPVGFGTLGFGLPVALALAKAFKPVIGFDISRRSILALRDGKDTTGEVTKQALAETSLPPLAEVTKVPV